MFKLDRGDGWWGHGCPNITVIFTKKEIKKKKKPPLIFFFFPPKRTPLNVKNSRAEFTLEPLHHTDLKRLIKYSICSHTSPAAAGIHLKSASCESVTSIWQIRVGKGKNKLNLLIHLMLCSLKSRSKIFYKNTSFFSTAIDGIINIYAS